MSLHHSRSILALLWCSLPGVFDGMPNAHWLVYLLVAAGWTTFFSMFNAPGIRGWRNVSLLATYITGIVMFFRIAFLSTAGTWAALGLASGLLYFIYEAWGYLKTREVEQRPRLRTIAHGLLAWPIMLPEVIEYTLAEIGVLKAPPPVDRAGSEPEAAQPPEP